MVLIDSRSIRNAYLFRNSFLVVSIDNIVYLLRLGKLSFVFTFDIHDMSTWFTRARVY